MKNVFQFLKQEASSVLLVLLSLIPLLLCGWLLDISLIQWSTRVGESLPTLSTFSGWVHSWIAGYRGLPQEIMLCIWVLMVLSLVINALFAVDHAVFRARFMYSFVFVWLLAVSLALAILSACASPFDLLLARIEDGRTLSIQVVRTLLVAELALLIVIPVGILLFRRAKGVAHKGAAEIP
jgi:hypothetical protein